MNQIGSSMYNLLFCRQERSLSRNNFSGSHTWPLTEILEAVERFNGYSDPTARDTAIRLYCQEIGLPVIRFTHVERKYLVSLGGLD